MTETEPVSDPQGTLCVGCWLCCGSSFATFLAVSLFNPRSAPALAFLVAAVLFALLYLAVAHVEYLREAGRASWRRSTPVPASDRDIEDQVYGL